VKPAVKMMGTAIRRIPVVRAVAVRGCFCRFDRAGVLIRVGVGFPVGGLLIARKDSTAGVELVSVVILNPHGWSLERNAPVYGNHALRRKAHHLHFIRAPGAFVS
jgi:hypothetical protein